MIQILVSTAFSNLRFVFFLKTIQAADTSYVLSTAVYFVYVIRGWIKLIVCLFSFPFPSLRSRTPF